MCPLIRRYKGLGFTTLQSTLLDAASSMFQIVSLLLAGYVTPRFRIVGGLSLTSARRPDTFACGSRTVSAQTSCEIWEVLSLRLRLRVLRAVRVITMALGNITCIIAAACLIYLPQDQRWNRLVAYWFTSFQVRRLPLDSCWEASELTVRVAHSLSGSRSHWS